MAISLLPNELDYYYNYNIVIKMNFNFLSNSTPDLAVAAVSVNFVIFILAVPG